jgi:hypothetical protein
MFNRVTNIGNLEQVRLWDGCLSYWKLDETSGTTAFDSIGNINLTKSSVDIITGVNNNAVDFTATSSRIYASSTSDFSFERTDSWTFGFWYKYGDSTGRPLVNQTPMVRVIVFIY